MSKAGRVLILGTTLLASCAVDDPNRQRATAALGDEIPGIPPGPAHRSGQPCGLCHSAEGGARGWFSLSGTLYRHPGDSAPLGGAVVRFIDATGAQHQVVSNCAGNFYVEEGAFTPMFPVWLRVEVGDRTAEMRSAIFRERSCGTCHADPASPSSVGHVYFAEAGVDIPATDCQ